MKRLMSVCAAAVCAALAFAKPKAEWLPADVDVSLAAMCEQQENTALTAAWKEALTGLHPALDELLTQQQDLTQMMLEEPEAFLVIQALTGFTAHDKRITLKSLAMGVTLPPSEEQMDNAKVVLILENPAFKMETFDAAVKVLLDKKQKWQESKVEVVKQGDWSLLQKAEEGKPADAVLCYKPCAQGVMFVLAKELAVVEAWLAGPKLAADAPVAAPFAVVKKPSDCAYAVKDVAELLARYMTDQEMRKPVELHAPWLFKTHRVMISGSLEGVNGVLKVAATTDSAEVAGQLKSALDMYRMMAAQMILPAVFQKPDAALSTWLMKSVTLEAVGAEAQLKAVFEPKEVAAIAKEFLELQAKQGQDVDSLFDDEDDEALSDDEDDEDAEMTVEEAKKILDGIEAK